MLHKTRGVVFRFTKYGETSIIVTLFTELFGLQSYIVNGVRSKSSKNKIALFQPLTLLDLVVYHRENANINRIKEVKCLYPYQSIPTDIKKSALAIFIMEVINKTVKEESHAQQLCEFFIHSFITLDQMEDRSENFHIVFLLRMSRMLGFGAHHVNEVLGARVTSLENEAALDRLIKSDYLDYVPIQNHQRREILDLVLKFYADHMDNLGEMKSIQVLREIL
ncbi:MAG TPA: DNA repair protein RecO [Chryseolinea sp.]|nr:DNA repair protein RecO [Chryseolinea sp.]